MKTGSIGGWQTLAAMKKDLRPCVKSVLVEVMTGVTRSRMAGEVPIIVTYCLWDGGLQADVTTKDGSQIGSWAVQIRAL